MKEQKPNLRILLVVPFTKPDYSGSGINAFNFARFLNRKECSSTVLTFNRNLKLKSREIIDSVLIRRITYFNRNLILKILSLIFIIPSYVIQIIRNDVVIIYGAHIIGYQFLISLSRLMKKIVVFRSLLLGADDLDTLVYTKTEIFRRVMKSQFRKVDIYFAINPVFADQYRQQTGREDNIVLSPQGVDVSKFMPVKRTDRLLMRQKQGIADDQFVVLSVGFLINRKGFTGAFRVLKELGFDFKYIVVGEHEFQRGHFMHKHAEIAEEIRLEGVRILGDRFWPAGAEESIFEYYQMADIVLINSSSEGLSNTLQEAMACGKVVLVKDIPGVDYLVTHLKTGLVFKDDSEMLENLKMLKNDPVLSEQIGIQAANHIQSFASFETTWDTLKYKLGMIKP